MAGLLEVWLYGKNSAGSSNLVIDNLWTMPLQGGNRQYNIIGEILGTSQAAGTTAYKLWDNEAYQDYPQLFLLDGSGNRHYNINVLGDIIHLEPGKINRIWAIREDSDGRNPASYGDLSVRYYPRRLKL